MLTENKYSKYLIYSIGEILLVVIGILIAIWVNNLNTEHQQKLQEISILKELKEDFQLDILDFEINVLTHNESNTSIDIILKSLDSNRAFNDSLAYYFANSIDLPISVIHTNAFDVLKSKGLELISNNDLRKKILNIHGQSYQELKTWENQPNREFYLKEILLRFDKLDAWNKDNTGKYTKAKMIPHNYESLKSDVLYKSIMNTIKSDNQRLLNHNYLGLIKQIELLISDIDDEINY